MAENFGSRNTLKQGTMGRKLKTDEKVEVTELMEVYAAVCTCSDPRVIAGMDPRHTKRMCVMQLGSCLGEVELRSS